MVKGFASGLIDTFSNTLHSTCTYNRKPGSSHYVGLLGNARQNRFVHLCLQDSEFDGGWKNMGVRATIHLPHSFLDLVLVVKFACWIKILHLY
jgi:hypothetical protein